VRVKAVRPSAGGGAAGSAGGEGPGEDHQVAEPVRARELAILLIGALEGGFLLSRAARSTEPMLALGRAVVEVVRASLPGG
jgi:hypothetical protein